MSTTLRLVPQAPTQPLPELAAFLQPFHVRFARSEGPQALERYVTGLLTELPDKNCQTIADNIPGTSEQRLQGLLTTMAWDQDDLNRQRVQFLAQLPSEGDGALIFDDTGCAKQGKSSVGVARQYSGTLGKVGNCPVTVNCHSAERTLAWPVASRLYLPKEWASDPARREEAQVPKEIVFQTQPQIALDLWDQAKDWGLRWSCAVTDAAYGDNPNFLDGLEKRRQRYVNAVRCDCAVSLSRRGGLAQRADVVVGALAARLWRSVAWREGSQGWLRGRFVAIRAWRIRSSGHRRAGWLIGEQTSDGKRKYYWSNLGAGVTPERLVESAHRRHWVERFHQDAKGLLGWDQYQGRRWQGFHRHAVSVMLAYSFLVWRVWQGRPERARPGCPRRAFSPSAGSAAAVVADGASAGRRLAAPGGDQGVPAA